MRSFRFHPKNHCSFAGRLTWLALAVCMLSTVRVAFAGSDAPCFDFSKKVVTSLKEIPIDPKGGDAEMMGTLPDNARWAALRGHVHHPIEKLLARLWDHELLRDPLNTGLEVIKLEPGPYLARHRANVYVKILFMKLSWSEDWAFALAEGTPEAPEKIVVSYQKVDGTHHIARMCYSLVLRRTPNGTDVSQYQEGRITGRAPSAMLNFLKMVLNRLRAPEFHCAGGKCSGDDPVITDRSQYVPPARPNDRRTGF